MVNETASGRDTAAVLELAQELIRRPTPNPPGDERALAEFLAGDLQRRGVEARVLPVGIGHGPQANVFARVRGSGQRPPLVLCGHLDTVPSGEGAWTRDPYTPVVEAGCLYGLGASDMKSAVAAMSVAAARLAAEAAAGLPLAADLLLAFTSGEETGSLGARAFAASGLLDGAAGIVIGEPTGNQVGIAEKGGMWLDVVMIGRTSHGSLPHLGANAVAGLAEVLVAIQAACGADVRFPSAFSTQHVSAAREDAAEILAGAFQSPGHSLLGRPTLTPTRVAGGVASNVVPDRARATLDIRTLPGQSGADIRWSIERLAGQIAARHGLRVEVINRGERVALDTPIDHPLARACVQAAEAALGHPPGICGLTGATDATELVPALGVPFVICGPGQMAQAHQPNEFVTLPALAASVEIYVRLARMLCR